MWISYLNALSANPDMSKFSLQWKRKIEPWKYIITFSNIKWHVKSPSDSTNMEIELTKTFRAQIAMTISHNKSGRDRVAEE